MGYGGRFIEVGTSTGAKSPSSLLHLHAALKRRSSTVAPAVWGFSIADSGAENSRSLHCACSLCSRRFGRDDRVILGRFARGAPVRDDRLYKLAAGDCEKENMERR